jgi:P-type E1-E2 ATPase
MARAGRTVVVVGNDRHVCGFVALADRVRAEARRTVADLRAAGVEHVVMLTGDNTGTAGAIAGETGVDEVYAELLPADKVAKVGELVAKYGAVAMVGDGVNDAPALAQANLGIAIGSGSDIAKETGDIVLVSGSLHGIVTAIGLSRATMRCIRQNLFFAFLYNVLAIPLAATGVLSPLIAAGAMALSDVTVLGNALRLRRTKID